MGHFFLCQEFPITSNSLHSKTSDFCFLENKVPQKKKLKKKK